MVAYIVGRGTDPLNSVDVTKSYSDEIQLFFEDNFGYPIILSAENQDLKLNNFSLEQNYPNPFNPTTKIKYSLPQSSNMSIKVYNVLGKEVATLVNKELPPGQYEVKFSVGQNSILSLTSGVYFYTLSAGSFRETKKMLILK
jgi:hypothetical protein